VYNGEVIAVKKLHPLQGLDDKSFEREFRNLRGIDHENVVRLLGYCYALKMKFVTHNGELVRAKEMERVLCFEYMQGGSLDKHISGIYIYTTWTILSGGNNKLFWFSLHVPDIIYISRYVAKLHLQKRQNGLKFGIKRVLFISKLKDMHDSYVCFFHYR